MGFAVNRNPTWMMLARMATTNATARMGRPIFAAQLRKAISRLPLNAPGVAEMEMKNRSISAEDLSM